MLVFFAGHQEYTSAAAGSVFAPVLTGAKVVSPVKTTMEQSSEAPKSPAMPVTAGLVDPHETGTGAGGTVSSPVKMPEAAASEAEKPSEPVVEAADEEEVDEEIYVEGPYDIPPSPPPQHPSVVSPPPRQVRRDESSSRSTPT